MSGYPDDPPPRFSRRSPPDFGDDNEAYRRSKPRNRRRDKYDASDEDDDPRRGSRDSGSKGKKESRSPEIPHPPIGEDRRPTADRQPERGMNGHGGPYARRKSLGSHSEEKRSPDSADKPRRSRSMRHADPYDDIRDSRRSGQPRGGHDDTDPRRRSSKPHDSRRDDLDGLPRSKTFPEDDPRRKPSRRDAPPRHKRPPYFADDIEPEYERPQRSHRSSRYRDDYGGYGTDRPTRQPRDDYDRGYRTDGRDSRHDRHRSSGRRHHDDHDDHDRSHGGSNGRRKKSGGPNLGEMMEKGQKNWKKVEPVAKPLLTQLAQAYLHKAGA